MPTWQQDNVLSAVTGEYYTLTGAGVQLAQMTLELDNKKITYFRKETSVWDMLAFIGGFSVVLHFAAQILYNFVSMNSENRLQQAFMLS